MIMLYSFCISLIDNMCMKYIDYNLPTGAPLKLSPCPTHLNTNPFSVSLETVIQRIIIKLNQKGD